MEISAPTFTEILNLLIAVGGFGAIVWGVFRAYRKSEREAMKTIVREEVRPFKETAEVAMAMAEKHEGVLYGINDPKAGLIAQVNYLQGHHDAEREAKERAAV